MGSDRASIPLLEDPLWPSRSARGDLTGNRESILRLHDEARAMGASLLVVPEMAITGYAPRDLLLRDGFVAAAEASLAQLASVTLDGPPMLVGTPRKVPGPRGLRNAVALLRKGVVESFHDKWVLPGYDVFDEDRWFDSGEEVLHFDLEGKSVAVLCCEDLWNGADAGVSGYRRDPLSEVDADLILGVSASPFVSGKASAQKDRLRQVSERTNATVAVLNQFGARRIALRWPCDGCGAQRFGHPAEQGLGSWHDGTGMGELGSAP